MDAGQLRVRHLALVAVAALVTPGCAWNVEGHDLITRLATKLLPEKKIKEIEVLLKDDFATAARWSTKMNAEFPNTEALHLQPQPGNFKGCSILHLSSQSTLCHGNHPNCLYSAMRYMFEKFASSHILNHFGLPSQKVPELPLLKAVPAYRLDQAAYLKWLMGLLADAHQPLHWGFPANAFGHELGLFFQR